AASGDSVVRDLQVAGATFDRAAAQISAHDGVATIQPVELTRAGTALQIHGTVQLPEHADDLGRSPAKFEVVSNDLDLGPITSAMEKPLSGHAQINGTLEIRDEQLQAGFRIASGPVSSGDFSLEKFEATGTAEKNLRLHSKDEPWFEGLRANATAVASAVRNSEFAVDTISGQLDQNGSLITISNVKVQRGSNQIVSNASVRLRADEKDFIKQPATIQVAIDSPETADFWNGNSANRVSGTLNASGIVQWNGAVADGWFNVYGSKLQIRNLSVPQLSGAGSMGQSRIFLIVLRPTLNHRASWNGRGSLSKLTENGFLKLAWKNGQLGNMKALTTNIDATYSPAGLEIPTFFIGSDRMDFQAIVSAEGEILEISKIQLDQGQAKYASGYASVPLIWGNVGTEQPVFPRDGKINATFDSANLDLKKLFDDFGIEPLASGLLSVKLQAGGTLANL